MSEVIVKSNSAGIRELLNSKAVQAQLLKTAERVSTTAGGDYKVDVQAGINRAHARIATKSWGGLARERRTNALLKASGGGA